MRGEGWKSGPKETIGLPGLKQDEDTVTLEVTTEEEPLLPGGTGTRCDGLRERTTGRRLPVVSRVTLGLPVEGRRGGVRERERETADRGGGRPGLTLTLVGITPTDPDDLSYSRVIHVNLLGPFQRYLVTGRTDHKDGQSPIPETPTSTPSNRSPRTLPEYQSSFPSPFTKNVKDEITVIVNQGVRKKNS